jgi:periplasmic protein TonB
MPSIEAILMVSSQTIFLERPGRPSHRQSNKLLTATIVIILHLMFLYVATVSSPGMHALKSGLNGARLGSVVEAAIYSAPAQKPDNVTQKTVASVIKPTARTEHRVHDRVGLNNAPALTAPSQDASEGTSNQSAAGSASMSSADLSSGSTSDLASDFQRRLLSRIQPFLKYPEEALAAHPEGTVQVLFAMNRDGTVVGAWIKQSSGSAVLDKEAIAAIMQAQPLPAIPQELPAPLNVELPVSFSQNF